MHRLGAALALCAYLFASFGLPLPDAPVRRDTRVPYPCMNNPCGCRDAEQCWRNCCCLTVEERWAWARANNVQPPDYAERPGAANARCTPEGGRKSCCHADGEHSSASGIGWALGVSALRCKGLASQWASAGAVLPPAPPLAWAPCPLPGEWLLPIEETLASFHQPPLAPPPR